MNKPDHIGVVDLMMGIPVSETNQEWYDSFLPLLKDKESIEQFHLGFAPNEWDWLLRRANADGISINNLIKIGLLATSSRTGRQYDRFKGRVLFSIRDTQHRPIAMGGRILPEYEDEKSAKYINSPETPLFSKSNQLYGLDRARDTITQQDGKRHAIVMEGYTDCVIANQFGFHESAVGNVQMM